MNWQHQYDPSTKKARMDIIDPRMISIFEIRSIAVYFYLSPGQNDQADHHYDRSGNACNFED